MHNSRVEHVGKLWALLCHASAMREGHSVPVAMVETCTDSAADGATDADSDGETYSAYVDYTCRDAAIDLATVTRTSPQPTTVTAAPSAATTVTPPAAAGTATSRRSTPYSNPRTAPSRSGCRTTTTTAGTRRAGAELARARTLCSVLYVSILTIPTPRCTPGPTRTPPRLSSLWSMHTVPKTAPSPWSGASLARAPRGAGRLQLLCPRRCRL